MPDVHIVNDDASFASSDTFSTKNSTEPVRQLSRRKTVSQLTRKVSKRISQSILGGAQPHPLSERNLKALDDASVSDPYTRRSSDHQLPDAKVYEPIHEDEEEECASVDVEAQKEARLHASYATFCQNFTMSGSTRMSRQFDLTMETEAANDSDQSPAYHTFESLHSPTSKWPGYITVYSKSGPTADAFPISSLGNVDPPVSQLTDQKKNSHDCSRPDTPIYEDNLSKEHPSFEMSRQSDYPQPPPEIMTPDVYMDMQREERERKAARRQRLLNPFRSWFMSSQSSWTRRYEVAE
ncbi:hypothetical protein N7541_005590 [Penicillium brevicompactum]|uniref:Uncharacterized protein n=1 Tax=Penicillium brevicompactum TaxID=5074 RepID=A0A9W9R6N5_PENBR|nr:hypothetical protein N7541_005590 [Penicillium brevicompactum]